MLEVTRLLVEKQGQPICQVEHLLVNPGERVTITGANGTGKSTLLRVIAGLEPSYSGTLVSSWPIADRVYVHQNPIMFQGSVERNVGFGLKSRGFSSQNRMKKTTEVMEHLQCRHLLAANATQLSAGERRRVALARAIVLAPALLLLDEPFAELDSSGVEVVCQVLKALDSTVLIASPVSIPSKLQSTTVVLHKPE
jgi:tungstate transport system ATP-binding protein